MADIIARFKGDTSDLDKKVGKASQSIQAIADEAQNGGKALNKLGKEQMQLVRDLGKLETGAKTAKGTIAELTKTFTNMSAVYNRLSEDEKKSPFGRELSKSLEQLKVRIKDGQTELKGINAELGTNGSLLEQVSAKFGVNIKALGTWGVALGAGKMALDTLKDAFFNNEGQLDEWGRIVQSSESAYNAFLNSLNTGDISGFLANIDSIISAARDAYNSLDELGTYNAFNQRNKARNNAGYSEALERYKKNPTADNKKALEEANRKVVADLSTEAQKSEAAYQTALRELAAQRGLNKKEQERFVKLFSNGSYGDLKSAKAGYGRSGLFGMNETWNGQRVVNGKLAIENPKRTVGGTTFRDMSASEKERFKFAQALSGVNDTEIKTVQALGAQAEQLRQSVADQNRQFNRMAGNNAPRVTARAGGKGGATTAQPKTVEMPAEGSIAYYQKLAQDAQKQINEAATDGARDAALAIYNEYSRKIKQLKEDADARASVAGGSAGVEINTASTSFGDALKAPQKLGKIEGADKLKTAGQKTAEAWENVSSAIGSVGSALAGIEDPGVKVMGTVAMAIATIASTFAKSLAGTMTPWDWIAAAASGTATMISTISAIKSATAGSFAEGGVIGGNSYYGDKLYARVNSGETILNQRQARTALDMMDGGGGVRLDASNLRLSASVRGEQLRFVLNANGRRTGRGEVAYAR